jgi:hypothetical protein
MSRANGTRRILKKFPGDLTYKVERNLPEPSDETNFHGA